MEQDSRKQDWTERVTKQIADIRKKKALAQGLYYKLRNDGVSHPIALAAVIDFLCTVHELEIDK